MTPLVGRAHLREHCNFLCARPTGFYHRVGAPTGPPLGTPASILSLAALCGPPPSAAFVLPHPMLQGISYVQIHRSVHKKHNTRRYGGHSLLKRFARSGRGYTDFHASVNFAFWDFSEVRSIEEGRDSSLLALALYFDSVLLLQSMVDYPLLKPPGSGAVLSREMPALGHGDRRKNDPQHGGPCEGNGQEGHPC